MTLPAAARLPREIADALGRGAQVLTASVRAARALGRAFAEDAQAEGLASWRAPAIGDWSGWLQQMYEAADSMDAALPLGAEPGGSTKAELPLLLIPLQEDLLWKRVQAAEAGLVVSPGRLAHLAQGAYQLLSDYDAHSSRKAPWAAAHEDAEHFLRWSSGFDALCAQLHVLPRAGLEAALREHAPALHKQHNTRELLLVGFDRLTPSQQRLLDALERAGIRVRQAALDEPAQPQLVCAADEHQELHACARWVRARLETDPHQRIAVLLPELAGARAELDRVFRRVLLPESARQPSGGPPPYEFSLGAPLASLPLIASALLLLRWLAEPLPAAEISSLLAGGFLAHDAAEAQALAQTDAALRRTGLLTSRLSLASLLRHAAAKPGLLPPGAHARIRAAALWTRREAASPRRSYAEWAGAAEAQLAALGWPGFRELDSIAYQARQRWEALLAEAARLGFAGGSLDWSAFVRELTGFARSTLFAAESRDAPVQILGAAEASGQRFDAIWFLQVTEARWPPGGRLHPLLAPGVQRDAGMPHSSAETDLRLAEEQLRRIAASAPVVVVSYARQSGGLDARPSPLLRHLGEAVAVEPFPSEILVPCATVHDPEPVAVAPWPLDRAAGGSDVLKRQAACGFQSFAVKRLGAHALEEESWGLDAGERATLLHAALEQLWSVQPSPARLHTSEDLARAHADGTLDAILHGAVARSFQPALRAADPWRTAYLALEQQRLHTRLRAWLDVERQRAPFRVIGLEQRMQAAPIAFDTAGLQGELRLNLRADRVDAVGDESELRTLILDYKTAATVGPALWAGDRPDEPQLPIYALFGGIENVAGIAFAQIRAGRTALHALAEDPAGQLGARETGKADKRLLPAETRAEWDRALRALAGQFARGEAPVNPKHGARTCQFCGLFGLCRVRSLKRGAMAEDLDEEPDDA